MCNVGRRNCLFIKLKQMLVDLNRSLKKLPHCLRGISESRVAVVKHLLIHDRARPSTNSFNMKGVCIIGGSVQPNGVRKQWQVYLPSNSVLILFRGVAEGSFTSRRLMASLMFVLITERPSTIGMTRVLAVVLPLRTMMCG